MVTLEPIEVQRGRCEECRDLLRDLTRTHLEIDAPTREVGADEPEWVFRLRKVCLHAIVISACAVDVDGMHTMTTELRAAYEQMAAVWECIPDGFRFAEDGSWWASEAKDRLAEFNHPTAFSLVMPLAHGGFDDAGAPDSYLRLAVWLGRLGCGYGLALGYLARVLRIDMDVDSRLEAVLARAGENILTPAVR